MKKILLIRSKNAGENGGLKLSPDAGKAKRCL